MHLYLSWISHRQGEMLAGQRSAYPWDGGAGCYSCVTSLVTEPSYTVCSYWVLLVPVIAQDGTKFFSSFYLYEFVAVYVFFLKVFKVSVSRMWSEKFHWS